MEISQEKRESLWITSPNLLQAWWLIESETLLMGEGFDGANNNNNSDSLIRRLNFPTCFSSFSDMKLLQISQQKIVFITRTRRLRVMRQQVNNTINAHCWRCFFPRPPSRVTLISVFPPQLVVLPWMEIEENLKSILKDGSWCEMTKWMAGGKSVAKYWFRSGRKNYLLAFWCANIWDSFPARFPLPLNGLTNWNAIVYGIMNGMKFILILDSISIWGFETSF